MCTSILCYVTLFGIKKNMNNLFLKGVRLFLQSNPTPLKISGIVNFFKKTILPFVYLFIFFQNLFSFLPYFILHLVFSISSVAKPL